MYFLKLNIKHINLDFMSLFYNSFFGLELFLKFLIFPKKFFINFSNLLSFIIIISSVISIYFEDNCAKSEHLFLKSTFLAMQLFRFCLIFKDILILKKFFLTMKVIFVKCTPIMTLFFLVIFFYGLIGN